MGSWAEVSVSQSVRPSGDSHCPGADTASGAIGGSIHLHPVSHGAGTGSVRAPHGSHRPPRDGPGWVMPCQVVPSRAGRSRAEPSRAEPSRAGPSRAGPSRAEPSRAAPRSPYFPGGRHRLRLYRYPIIPLLIGKFFLSDNLIVQSNHLRDIAHPSSQKRKQRGWFCPGSLQILFYFGKLSPQWGPYEP